MANREDARIVANERAYDAETNVCAVQVDPRQTLHERVEHNMTNHPPRDYRVVAAFDQLRIAGKAFAHAIVDLCPESREQSLALTAAEEALMWAVASVARD